MGDEIPRDPMLQPHTCRLPPEISPSKEGTVSRRGVSGLRQKCGLGGQGWRRRGGAKRPESLGL